MNICPGIAKKTRGWLPVMAASYMSIAHTRPRSRRLESLEMLGRISQAPLGFVRTEKQPSREASAGIQAFVDTPGAAFCLPSSMARARCGAALYLQSLLESGNWCWQLSNLGLMLHLHNIPGSK